MARTAFAFYQMPWLWS